MVVFHVEHPTPKHVENSVRGIKAAKRRGFAEIDLDLLLTKDGRIVGCHWPRPMEMDGFTDPYGELGEHRTVASMTFAEVHRLKAKTGFWTYRIQPIELLINQCAKSGVGPVLEPKDHRFNQRQYWNHLAAVADDAGVDLRMYALPKFADCVRAAKAAGVPGHVIGESS